MQSYHFKRNRILWAAVCLLFSAVMLTGCGRVGENPAAAPGNAETVIAADDPVPVPDTASKIAAVTYEGLIISEVMVKNTSTLLVDGAFPDWIELCNTSESDRSLCPLTLSDGKHSFPLPERELAPGEYVLFLCGSAEGCVSFSLSEKDTLTLSAPDGTVLSRCDCSMAEPDASLIPGNDGFSPCSTPTPGYSNDADGYERFLLSQQSPSPLRINEVFAHGNEMLRTCDWVELLNTGDAPVSLSDYSLSDDYDALHKLRLPEADLAPGEYYLCNLGDDSFSLGSGETLFLTLSDTIVDFAALKTIPPSGSIGRENAPGWFLYSEPSPEKANAGGYRSMAPAPALNCPDGVYAPGEEVEISFSDPGEGQIYYTLDCTHPTEKSLLYTGPITLGKDTVLRAVRFREGCLPSEVSTFSFFFAESSLPVVSLVGDDPAKVALLKKDTDVNKELPAVVSLYEEDGSFTAPCGVQLSGNSSRKIHSKSFAVYFRSCYGSDGLDYDVFDTGVTHYHSLRLRRGYEALESVYKNELIETLASSFTDACPIQNSRFARMYINGSYWGLVSLRDDFSATYFSEYYGGKKSSVDYIHFPVNHHSDFYTDVIQFCANHPDSGETVYEQLSPVIDMDSLIDWIIVKGLVGDSDYYPNIACYRSSASDYKWRFCLWDFDQAGKSPFVNMLSVSYNNQYSPDLDCILTALFSSAQFRSRFLLRLDDAIHNYFTKEQILPLMDEYEELLREEVTVSHRAWGIPMAVWEKNTSALRSQLTGEVRWTDMLRTLRGFPYLAEEDLTYLLPGGSE